MKSRINRNSPVPYYAQVIELLQEQIQQGEWQSGDQLPGEPELCRIFGVSRTVVRQALDHLARQQIIVRVKGRGTFIAETKISGGLVQTLTGFHHDMVRQGFTPFSKILNQEIIPATPKIASTLELPLEAEIFTMKRLRYVENIPLNVGTTYLPLALCPSIVDVDFRYQSLYEYLEIEYGIKIARGKRVIEAVLASKEESQLLEVSEYSPLIMLESISYLEDGTPLEYFHTLHRSDRVRFEVELMRPSE